MTTATAPVATKPSPLKQRLIVAFDIPGGKAGTHRYGHVDEYGAIVYFRRYGSPQLNPWAQDEFLPRRAVNKLWWVGVSPQELRADDDEHPWAGRAVNGNGHLSRVRKTEEQADGTLIEIPVSCISLFADAFEVPINKNPNKRIQLSKHPVHKRTIKYFTDQDQGAPGRITDLPKMVKLMHLLPELDDHAVFDWFDTALAAREDEKNVTITRDDYGMDVLQFLISRSYGDLAAKAWTEKGMEALANTQRLFEAARDTLLEIVDQRTLTLRLGAEGPLLCIGYISSANPRIGAASRSAGINWDIIIQHHPASGHVQLYTNKRWNQNQGDKLLNTLVPMLQIAEQERRVALALEPYVYLKNPELLSREGNPFPHSVWYNIYGMLLNGSLTAPDVSATRLTLAEIWDLLLASLFESGFQEL